MATDPSPRLRRLAVEIQHADTGEQVGLGQVRMLMPAQCAIDQPMAILNIEGEAAHQRLLFVTLGNEVEAILIFGVQHDNVRVGFGRARGWRIQMTMP